MTDAVTAELVEASRRVLDAELAVPTGLQTQPLIQRWKAIAPQLAALGWFDLLAGPEAGGLGLSPAHATRLVRLAGWYLVPGPVIEQVLTVPWLLTQPGARPGMLSDHAWSAIAAVDPCRDLPYTSGRGPVRLDRGRARGTARCVLGVADAEALLVHAIEDDAERLLILPASHPGVHVEPLPSADPCQSAGQLELDCEITQEQVICPGDALLPGRLRAWRRLGAGAYLAGIAERVLAFGVDYAGQREQFGRPIGSFQAVQHLLADVAVTASSLANLMDLASIELPLAADDEGALIAVTAKARASAEAVLACETVLQVLGGIGFTVEHPLHHYLKRALSLAAQHGCAAELNLLAGRSVLARVRRGALEES